MYEQVFDPISNSLGLTAIFAALPLIALFVLLGAFRVAAWISGLAALAVAIVVSILVYDVPVGQSLDMGLEGAAFGLFPIMWIVVNAVWIYNMTEKTDHFAVLRRSFATVSNDQRIQAVIIAFSFGALIDLLPEVVGLHPHHVGLLPLEVRRKLQLRPVNFLEPLRQGFARPRDQLIV